MIVDLSFPEYLALDRASSHRLWTLLTKSPLHMRSEIDRPRSPNGGMQTGTILHALLSGTQIAVIPSNANRKSNEGKANLVAWLEEITGHEAPRPPPELQATGRKLDHQIAALQAILDVSDIDLCTQDQHETAQRMRDSLMSKRLSQIIFESGRSEVSVLQTDPQSGIDVKARLDWLPDGRLAVVDPKSTRNVSYDAFAADAARYGYHLQAAMYSWIYDLEYGQWPAFFFAVVENEPPYDSAIFEADEDFIAQGMMKLRIGLDIYSECQRLDFWPGCDWDWEANEHSIQRLTLPKWAKQ